MTARPPLTRALLLHTGGSFWVDVTGMVDRHERFLCWLPGSPEVELGLLPGALQVLPLREVNWGRIGHIMLGLAPHAAAPAGPSGQLAVAAACLWLAHASASGLPTIAVGEDCPPDQPLIVLTGSGAVMQEPVEDGVFRYAVDAVTGWREKALALDRALAGRSVHAIHVVCPRRQLMTVRDDFLQALPDRVRPDRDERCLVYRDHVKLRLHPVATLDELAQVVAVLASGAEGKTDDDLIRHLEELDEIRRKRQMAGEDTRGLDTQIQHVKQRLRQGQPLRVDDILAGRYRLVAEVGEGGFGTVWKAEDLHESRPVAIKVLHARWAKDASRIESFFRGAGKMAELRHPNIARVAPERGRHGPHYYFVMEYLFGYTLEKNVVDKRLGTRAALECVLQVGDALQYAHQKALLHCDVKPQNILLDSEGRARLTDFDLARRLLPAYETQARDTGSFEFGAPELRSRNRPVDERADLYSLAMTAVFVLHGDHLPENKKGGPGAVIDDLPCAPAVKKVLRRATRDEPETRQPRTVREFCSELGKVLDAPRPHLALATLYDRTRRRALSRRPIQAAALALLVVSAYSAWQVSRMQQAVVERDVDAAHSLAERADLRMRAALLAEHRPAEALALWRAFLHGDGKRATGQIIEEVTRLGRDGGPVKILPSTRGKALVDMATSPDGRYIAASDEDGWVELWDIQEGRLVRSLDTGLPDGASLHYMPDGKRLVSHSLNQHPSVFSEHRALRIWDVASGSRAGELSGHDFSSHHMAVDPGGQWMAACGVHGVRVWHSPDQYTSLPGARWCSALAFSLQSRLAVSRRGHDGGPARIEIWGLDSGQPERLHVFDLPGHGQPVTLAMSPDGRYLAAGMSSTKRASWMSVWDMESERLVGMWSLDANRAMVFSAAGDRLVTLGLSETSALLWDTTSWQQIARLQGHHARQHALAMSGDGTLVATGAFDGSIGIFSASTGESLAWMSGHIGHIYDLAFVQGERREAQLVSISQDGTLRIWSMPAGAAELTSLLAPAVEERYLQHLSEDGTLLLTASRDGRLTVWDVEQRALRHSLAQDEPLARALFIGRERLLTVAEDGTLRQWSLDHTSRPIVAELGLDPDEGFDVRAGLVLSADRRTLAVTTNGHRYLWDLDVNQRLLRCRLPRGRLEKRSLKFIDSSMLILPITYKSQGNFAFVDTEACSEGQQVTAHDDGISAMAVSQDRSVLATASYDRTAKLWDLASGAHLHTLGHDKQVVDVAISPDGRRIATASWDTTARIWDRKTGALLHVLAGHDNHVQMAVFSPDGRFVATGSKDSTVRLWSVESGELITVLYGHLGTIVDIRFSADGTSLVSLDYRGTARKWRLEPAVWWPDPVAATGALTNLRVCRNNKRVVPVAPFPPATTIWAPEALCQGAAPSLTQP